MNYYQLYLCAVVTAIAAAYLWWLWDARNSSSEFRDTLLLGHTRLGMNHD